MAMDMKQMDIIDSKNTKQYAILRTEIVILFCYYCFTLILLLFCEQFVFEGIRGQSYRGQHRN